MLFTKFAKNTFLALSLIVYSTAFSQDKPKLHLVEVNQVDQQVYVHTFKIDGQNSTVDSDQLIKVVPSEEINSFIEQFNSIRGVSEVAFDHATFTFTIVSSRETLEDEIERLTQKK